MTRWPGSAPLEVAALRAAIADDPFAADLHRNLAGVLLETGDKAGADAAILAVHRISPRSRIVLTVWLRQ